MVAVSIIVYLIWLIYEKNVPRLIVLFYFENEYFNTSQLQA